MDIKNTLLILLCFFFSIYSCIGTTEKTTDKEGLLWKISGNGLKRPSYLFGTHHYISGKYLDKVRGFVQVFDSVQQLIVEINIDSLNGKLYKKNRDASKFDRFLPEGIKYSDLLDERDYSILDSITIKQWGLHADKVPLKPSVLYKELYQKTRKPGLFEFFFKEYIPDSLLIYVIDIGTRIDEDNLFMDFYLTENAKDKKYKIIGLESMEYSVGLALSPTIDIKSDAKSTVYSLINQDKISETTALSSLAYLQQDLKLWQEEMNSIAKLSYSDGMGLYEVKERNQNWISIIKSVITQESSMIAVGAGHLLGEYGLIELLRKEGYIVENYR